MTEIGICNQAPDGAEPEWKYAAADIKDGLGNMLPAARTRANATYYGFICLSLGLIVMVSNACLFVRIAVTVYST